MKHGLDYMMVSSLCFTIIFSLASFSLQESLKESNRVPVTVNSQDPPPPPLFPDFYHSIFMIRNETNVLLSGPVWYDFRTQKYRLDIKDNRVLQSSVQRFDLKKEYKVLYSVSGKTCTSRSLNGSLAPPLDFNNPTLTYVGVEVVWGSMAVHWTLVKDGHKIDFWTLSDKTSSPWQMYNYTTKLYMNWQFFDDAEPEASLFEPPSGVTCTSTSLGSVSSELDHDININPEVLVQLNNFFFLPTNSRSSSTNKNKLVLT